MEWMDGIWFIALCLFRKRIRSYERDTLLYERCCDQHLGSDADCDVIRSG